MLNSVGLQGPGVTAWLEHDLPALAAAGARVVVSIWGRTRRGLRPGGGAARAAAAPGRWSPSRSTSAAPTSRTARACSPTRRAPPPRRWRRWPCGLPRWAKLSPNVADVCEIAGAALGAGAEAVDAGQHAPRDGRSTSTGAARCSGRAAAACRGRPCTRWPCGRSWECRRGLPRGAASSGWAGCAGQRRGRAAARRGRRGAGGHGHLRRPAGPVAGARRAGALVPPPPGEPRCAELIGAAQGCPWLRTFGAVRRSLRRRWPATGPLCAGIDPSAELCWRRGGSTTTRSGLRAVRRRAASRPSPGWCRWSSPRWPSSSGTASAGHGGARAS